MLFLNSPTVSSTDWSNLGKGGVAVHQIEGDHYTIVQEPQVKNLAEQLRASLNSTFA